MKLEMIMRLLDNGELSPEEVDIIREDVETYLSENQVPSQEKKTPQSPPFLCQPAQLLLLFSCLFLRS